MFRKVFQALVALGLVATPYAAYPQPATRVIEIEITDGRTEAYNLIGMQYMVVGGLADRCQQPLERPPSFAGDTLRSWAASNTRYTNAYAKYRQALFAFVKAQKGDEGLAAENARHRQITVRQAGALIEQAFANREPKAVCERFEQQFASGGFNIGPNFPLFPLVGELLRAVGE